MPLILENAPDVEFREVAGLFIASFRRPTAALQTTPETTQETAETTKETTKETPETTKETPKKHQRNMKDTLLQLIRQQPEITAAALATAVGIGVDGVNYHLNQLKRSGKLRRHGPTKGGYWEVID